MSNYFTVLPMNHKFSLEAGKTYTSRVIVVNPADATEDFSYQVTVVPYNIADDSTVTDFVTISERSEIAKWITISNPKGTLSPNESREVEFTINVPENAAAGGQYAAIMVGMDTSGEENQGVAINNSYELASVIYANVEGETVRDGVILDNYIPAFSLSPDVEISTTIENRGNVHDDATFELKITNLLTGEVIYPREGQAEQFTELILPGAKRYIVRKLANLPKLGAVKISQSVYYNYDASMKEQVLYICPLWFILLVFFAIAATATLIVSRIRKRHRDRKEEKSTAL